MDLTRLDKIADELDRLNGRFDAMLIRRNDRVKIRKDATSRKRSGFGTRSMRELDEKHQQALKPLLEARDKEAWHSPSWQAKQNAVYALQNGQNAEMLALQSKIEEGENK